MRKLPGIVSIESGIVDGARVQIDGVDIGLTRLSGVLVEPGDHQMTISKERLKDESI